MGEQHCGFYGIDIFQNIAPSFAKILFAVPAWFIIPSRGINKKQTLTDA